MKRRKAREYALQLLFRVDFTDKEIDKNDLEEFWADKNESEDVRKFTEEIVSGTLNKIKEIDMLIEKFAENWALNRMAVVDRNILRFATYEIFYRDDIPSAVTINEALEIAKKYSSSESVPFLNGVLDRLAREAGKG